MIGVLANRSEYALIREFFDLFKTPWEFYREGRNYEVLLCSATTEYRGQPAHLVLLYSAAAASANMREADVSYQSTRLLEYKGEKLPLYCATRLFSEMTGGVLVDGHSGHSALRHVHRGDTHVVQVAYDLFAEIRHLLVVGQPPVHAGSPALELHIALLRDLICSAGIVLAEIPPVPLGFEFIACLTHDIDHPRLRNHKFDRTMFGFFYRTTVRSFFDLLTGRTSAANMLRNWKAALKLPLVAVGMARDPWADFDRYTEIEANSPSTFFAIPFRKTPGRSEGGAAPSLRAAQYGAGEIGSQLLKLSNTGCEIALHGIDAWADSASGRKELAEIRSITGAGEIGVRMHWLYFSAESPHLLEEAGASYDSSIGYNETIGFRAGTTQAYKPLSATKLLELPMHIMDTALFYPGHLHLTVDAAEQRIAEILEVAVEYGGCVTINWHDRSIACERQWGKMYAQLVTELKDRGAWLTTAAQAVQWFRKRRSVQFEGVEERDGSVRVKLRFDGNDALPGLRLRIHRPEPRSTKTSVDANSQNIAITEFPLPQDINSYLPIESSGGISAVELTSASH